MTMQQKSVEGLLAAGAHVAEALTEEALRHLFHSIPFGLEFDLSDGRRGRLKKFHEPKERDGELVAGVDVEWWEVEKPDLVHHVEFMISKGGWGMAVEPTPFDPEQLPAEIPEA